MPQKGLLRSNAEIPQKKNYPNYNGVIIEKALHANFKVFEDAWQYFGAIETGSDMLITGNGKDFKTSDIPIMTAEEYLASIHKRWY